MTKRVQILGHDAETANAFIGFERELTVDTDNDEIRLHDGATPGGHKILNRDSNDARYQARSEELDAFLGWESEARGFLVRRGPGDYALRELTSVNSLTITYDDGHDGAPVLELKTIIGGVHTWEDAQTFEGVIHAEAGIIGNLNGDSSGTHTGNVTGNLTGNANGSHTGTFTGNVNVSGQTLTLDDEQIPASKIAGLDVLIPAVIDVGIIVMWSGAIVDIPAGWALCDGTGGTPDLRDRFIIGAGNTYDPLDTGGTSTHTHTITVDAGGAHIHTASSGSTALSIANLPAHAHLNGVCDNSSSLVFNRTAAAVSPATPDSIESNSSDGVFEGTTSSVGSGTGHTHTVTVDSGGSHTHSASNALTNHIPPYYALCFIQRVAS